MNTPDIDTISLDQIPFTESDYFEFKSSRLKNDLDSLRNKLCKAVSGFANSGGGYFIAGIDEKTGNADGGIPLTIKGRRPLQDWLDTVIHQSLEPVPSYTIKLIVDPSGRGVIDQGSAILIIYIPESHLGPHMMEGSYYIRAGVHTNKARNFIVEAIRAKRYNSNPKLTHLFRFKPSNEQVLQLGILALADAPAINTTITLAPLPKLMKGREADFPIQITVIDKNNPFYFDVSLFHSSNDDFGDDVTLLMEYFDIFNNKYVDQKIIGVNNATPPIKIGSDPDKKIVKALESIEKVIGRVNNTQKCINKSNIVPPRDLKGIFNYVNNLIPELLEEMRIDLVEQPFIREFIIIGKHWVYNNNPNNDILCYFFEDHTYLRNKLRILENCNLVYEITYNTTDRFIMSEQLVEYLTRDNLSTQ